jgi:Tol biopolymer transport system component
MNNFNILLMKNATIVIVLVVISHFAFSQLRVELKNAPGEPALLGEGFISTSINERDFALSPNGKEIYFTISTPQSTFQTIVFSQQDQSGNWSAPAVVSFAGHFSDLEPTLSADGKKLYFASNRPIEGNKPKDFDIWVTERSGNAWSTPKNLGAPVNTEFDEFYPSIAKNGNLYFTAQYKEGVGREDIFMAQWRNGNYEKPVPLDTAINSKGYEFNAYVDPDEKFLLFTGYGRKDDMGRGDLYVSLKDMQGKWLPSKNIKFLNSTRLDYCPFVSPDKKVLFFTSERGALPVSFESKATYDQIQKINESTLNGMGNIYWVSFEKVLQAVR